MTGLVVLIMNRIVRSHLVSEQLHCLQGQMRTWYPDVSASIHSIHGIHSIHSEWSTDMTQSTQHLMVRAVTVTVAGTCIAMLCMQGALGLQGADGDADRVCAANAQTLKVGYAAADPGQFSPGATDCDAAGAEKYAVCGVRGIAGSCASVPACPSNLTLSIGCIPSNADTGCCQQFLSKECPSCEPTVDYCTDNCGNFTMFGSFSSYPPEVVEGYCTNAANVILSIIDRDTQGAVSTLGCDVATARNHEYCGIEGSAGSCSSKSECTGVGIISTSTCFASNSAPTCCSVALGKKCSVCEPAPVTCTQVCNLILPAPSLAHDDSDGAGPGPAAMEGSPLAASSSTSEGEDSEVRTC